MNERLKELRKALNLTMESFGSRLGVGKSAINKLEKGENNITDQMQKLICSEFNVNADWLLFGTGDMFVTHTYDEEVAMYVQDILDDEDDAVAQMAKDFIVTYCKLDENSKEVLRQFAKDLIDLQNKRETP